MVREMNVMSSPQGLSTKESECDDDGRWPPRSGTWRTGVAHIVTAVIGSGVLSLGWSVAQLGWIGGSLTLIIFSIITWYTACLLCEAYRLNAEPTGRRLYTYQEVVSSHLGPVNAFFCSVIQHLNLVATGVGYTVTGSLSLAAVKRAVCFHEHNSDPYASCAFANNPWLLMFGGMQVIFSQIPNFGQLWWLSYLATAMSFAYAFIGLGLSIGKASEKGHADYGTLGGTNHGSASAAATSWNVFVALGSIAFAYSFSMVLVEIQDTLAQKPSEIQSMKKSTGTSIAITTFFYTCIGCISYAGFGNASPGNLVTGFGFFEPYWLVGAANVFVFIHLLGAYQVFLQPFMAFCEISAYRAAPQLRREWIVAMPCGFGKVAISPYRLLSRTITVCFTTFLAILLPFFNDLVGILGSLGFWPLTIYFPIECHIKARGITRSSQKWWWLQALSLLTLLITIASLIGSVEFVVQDLKSVRLFNSVSSGSAAAS